MKPQHISKHHRPRIIRPKEGELYLKRHDEYSKPPPFITVQATRQFIPKVLKADILEDERYRLVNLTHVPEQASEEEEYYLKMTAVDERRQKQDEYIAAIQRVISNGKSHQKAKYENELKRLLFERERKMKEKQDELARRHRLIREMQDLRKKLKKRLQDRRDPAIGAIMRRVDDCFAAHVLHRIKTKGMSIDSAFRDEDAESSSSVAPFLPVSSNSASLVFPSEDQDFPTLLEIRDRIMLEGEGGGSKVGREFGESQLHESTVDDISNQQIKDSFANSLADGSSIGKSNTSLDAFNKSLDDFLLDFDVNILRKHMSLGVVAFPLDETKPIANKEDKIYVRYGEGLSVKDAECTLEDEKMRLNGIRNKVTSGKAKRERLLKSAKERSEKEIQPPWNAESPTFKSKGAGFRDPSPPRASSSSSLRKPITESDSLKTGSLDKDVCDDTSPCEGEMNELDLNDSQTDKHLQMEGGTPFDDSLVQASEAVNGDASIEEMNNEGEIDRVYITQQEDVGEEKQECILTEEDQSLSREGIEVAEESPKIDLQDTKKSVLKPITKHKDKSNESSKRVAAKTKLFSIKETLKASYFPPVTVHYATSSSSPTLPIRKERVVQMDEVLSTEGDIGALTISKDDEELKLEDTDALLRLHQALKLSRGKALPPPLSKTMNGRYRSGSGEAILRVLVKNELEPKIGKLHKHSFVGAV